jgi:ribose transport system ATP-binding protein
MTNVAGHAMGAPVGICATTTSGDAPAFEFRALTKQFGGTQALKGVNLEIRAGEVHGLLGENGSGKSTLIKVLAGFHAPEAGELYVNGHPVALPLQAGQFREFGASFVHQDLGLIPSLTVLENLRISDFGSSGKHRWRIPWARERRRARALFEQHGLPLDPTALVSSLKSVERAMLAIVRAVEELRAAEEIYERKGLLVLDEPTVFLPKPDVDRLFALVREIAATGDSVLFVSHDLDEVRDVTDRATVLRDGRNVGTVVTADVSEAELIALIIGRHLEMLTNERKSVADAGVYARVREVTGGSLRGVSFDVHQGEVLGLTGLTGSGFDEVLYFLFGARNPEGGRIDVDGVELDLTRLSPGRAVGLGIALVTENRQRDGAVASLPIVDNMTLQVLPEFFNSVWLDWRQMNRRTANLMDAYDVRPRNPKLAYGSLSGGNQQKALLAKWLQIAPTLLLLHEPTQGVDVGARQQIFNLLRDVGAKGTPVICASTDHEQLAAVCHRVLVFGRGEIVQQLTDHELTKERITEQCYNSVGPLTRLEPVS